MKGKTKLLLMSVLALAVAGCGGKTASSINDVSEGYRDGGIRRFTKEH